MSVAVGWQVYELTRKPVSLGYAGLVQFLPGILLFLVAGHCADRFDRRKILMVCFASYVTCAALLGTLTFSGHVSVSTIYGLLALTGATPAIAGPAAQSLTPELVAAEHFPNAVAWGSTIFTASTILGPMQECRLLLGTDCELTDAQIELLREQLYAVANVALDTFCEVCKTPDDIKSGASKITSVYPQGVAGQASTILELNADIQEKAKRGCFNGCVRRRARYTKHPLKQH